MLTFLGLFIVGAALGGTAVAVAWMRDRGMWASQHARLTAERDAAVRATDDARRAHDAMQTQTRETFAALSRSALKENRDDFLLNAQTLLTPVKDTLNRVQSHLEQVDLSREGSFQSVSAQLVRLREDQELLRGATEGLSRSLGSPNVRGTWGEVQLRRVVELAGMLRHCDFVEKQTTSTETGGRQTPDLIVRLPGSATIVVDSKVPIQAYREAVNATDDAARERQLALHTRQVRDHLKALGSKEYWKQFQPGPDMVVMFLPLEPLLAAAFERDEGLFDLAAAQRVIPATPMTLLALLKAAAVGWQQQHVAENAEEIQRLGRELYERLALLAERLTNVGKNIKQAAQSYDECVGSLEQKVLPGARRFKDLGVTSPKEIDMLDTLHLDVRTVMKPELTGRSDEADAPRRAVPIVRGTDTPN